MKKKANKYLTLLVLVSLLSGCLNNLDQEEKKSADQPANKVTAQVTSSRLSPDHYRAVITDGQYHLGTAASVDYNLSSTGNAFAFEDGLLRLSQEVFPTDQYYLQEGQLIDADTLTSWVSRESDENPDGLNPAAVGPDKEETTTTQESQESTEISVNEAGEEVVVDQNGNPVKAEEKEAEAVDEGSPQVESTPIYLSQIMEKNILVEGEDGYQLAGIVLGLSMNSTYEYTDPAGVVYKQEISVGEMRERGRAYANIIVGRLRATEELRSIPIVVGIYRQAPADEIVGGTYISDGISREGNAVSDWSDRNEYRLSLPLLDGGVEGEQYAYFDNFSKGVRDLFPNLNGVSAKVLYVDDQLKTLDIEIVTQFYQQTEIAALTQHVYDMARRYLPIDVETEIKISSNVGTEAYVGKKAQQADYQSYIFRQ